jgi:hypothetical protein
MLVLLAGSGCDDEDDEDDEDGGEDGEDDGVDLKDMSAEEKSEEEKEHIESDLPKRKEKPHCLHKKGRLKTRDDKEELKRELDKLLEDEKFCSPKVDHKNLQQDGEEDEEDPNNLLPAVSPLCRKCRPPNQMTLWKSSNGKKFYKCNGCGDFTWPINARKHLPSGSLCHCNHPYPTFPILIRETGIAHGCVPKCEESTNPENPVKDSHSDNDKKLSAVEAVVATNGTDEHR